MSESVGLLFGSLVRSLTCAAVRKFPPESDVQTRERGDSTKFPQFPSGSLPLDAIEDEAEFEAMRRRTAELDDEIAGLRLSLHAMPSPPVSGPVTPRPSCLQRPSTPSTSVPLHDINASIIRVPSHAAHEVLTCSDHAQQQGVMPDASHAANQARCMQTRQGTSSESRPSGAADVCNGNGHLEPFGETLTGELVTGYQSPRGQGGSLPHTPSERVPSWWNDSTRRRQVGGRGSRGVGHMHHNDMLERGILRPPKSPSGPGMSMAVASRQNGNGRHNCSCTDGGDIDGSCLQGGASIGSSSPPRLGFAPDHLDDIDVPRWLADAHAQMQAEMTLLARQQSRHPQQGLRDAMGQCKHLQSVRRSPEHRSQEHSRPTMRKQFQDCDARTRAKQWADTHGSSAAPGTPDAQGFSPHLSPASLHDASPTLPTSTPASQTRPSPLPAAADSRKWDACTYMSESLAPSVQRAAQKYDPSSPTPSSLQPQVPSGSRRDDISGSRRGMSHRATPEGSQVTHGGRGSTGGNWTTGNHGYSAPVSPASIYPSPYQPSHRWGAPLLSPSTASCCSSGASNASSVRSSAPPSVHDSACSYPISTATHPLLGDGSHSAIPKSSKASPDSKLSDDSHKAMVEAADRHARGDRISRQQVPHATASGPHPRTPQRTCEPLGALCSDLSSSAGTPKRPVQHEQELPLQKAEAVSNPGHGRAGVTPTVRGRRADGTGSEDADQEAASVSVTARCAQVNSADRPALMRQVGLPGVPPPPPVCVSDDSDDDRRGDSGTVTENTSADGKDGRMAHRDDEARTSPLFYLGADEGEVQAAAVIAAVAETKAAAAAVAMAEGHMQADSAAADKALAIATAAVAKSAVAVATATSPPRCSPCHTPSCEPISQPSTDMFSAPETPLQAWTPEQVGTWIAAIGLQEYSQVFIEQHVDGAALQFLSRDDLNALGVVTVGHRLRILRGITDLSGHTAPGLRSAAGAAVRELRFQQDG